MLRVATQRPSAMMFVPRREVWVEASCTCKESPCCILDFNRPLAVASSAPGSNSSDFPYWDASGGKDHIFLFSHDEGGM